MTAPSSIDPARFLHEQLAAASPDLLRSMLTTFVNTLMSAEADAVCGAGYGESSPQRVNTRNGYRHRDFDTRAGTLDVAIPKLRAGSYFPDWLLERRRRAERALATVVATCYLLGVSTRRDGQHERHPMGGQPRTKDRSIVASRWTAIEGLGHSSGPCARLGVSADPNQLCGDPGGENLNADDGNRGLRRRRGSRRHRGRRRRRGGAVRIQQLDQGGVDRTSCTDASHRERQLHRCLATVRRASGGRC